MYANLHCHSEYSLLDGLSSVDDLASAASRMGQTHLALTDHGTVSGAIAFVDACRRHGVTPIVGCEAYTSVRDTAQADRDAQEAKTRHLTILADGDTGYRSLLHVVSSASLDGFYHRPRVGRDLLAQHRDGLVVLSGCLGGEVAQRLLVGDVAGATNVAGWHREVFGDAYYLEAMDTGLAEQRQVIALLPDVARATGAPIVWTCDAHYAHEHQHITHDVLMAIQMRQTLADRRARDAGDRYHLRSLDEALASCPDPAWVRRTMEVAERCATPAVTATRQLFPKAPGEYGPAIASGMDWRYGAGWQLRRPDLVERLARERAVIDACGYGPYVQIVADLCRFARQVGIRIAARGSAAGSLVLYALGITDVDPVAHRLSFERFLNEGRTPDIDLDFEDARRGEVVRYLATTYGAGNVAGIVTFARMQGRTALRDVARVYGIGAPELARALDDLERIEGEIAKTGGEPRGALERLAREWDDRDWVDDARRLDGTIRHAGRHAAGVVVSSEPLMGRVPLARNSDDEVPVVALEMSDAERAGLVKFDILGLKTLTAISRAVALAEADGQPVAIDGDALPPDDPEAMAILASGRTVGVFQVESAGMQRYLQELRPTRIGHVQAMLALYRPGPISVIPSYIARARGREAVEYPHPAFEPMLKDTYGLVVYQEAIMEAATEVAGFQPGEADQLLAAVRKKRRDVLPKWRARFVEGCVAAGVPVVVVDRFWHDLEPFSNYGFNKAHAAAYALLTYQTAYLKAHRPGAFIAACLQMDAGDADRVAVIVADARRMGVTVTPPCVNAGDVGFALVDGVVMFGLGSVRHVGERGGEAIVEARRIGGPFRSAFEFRSRVPRRAVNARAMASLVDAGAFDNVDRRSDARSQLGLAPVTSRLEEMRREAEAIGQLLSEDVASTMPWDRHGRTHRVASVARATGRVTIGGQVLSRREQASGTGGADVWLLVGDETGEVQVRLRGDRTAPWRASTFVGAPVLVTGSVSGRVGDRYVASTEARIPLT